MDVVVRFFHNIYQIDADYAAYKCESLAALFAASSGIGSHVQPEELTKERPTQHVSAADGTPNPP